MLATVKAQNALRFEVVVLQLGMLDLTSPAGKLMLAMWAAVAVSERGLIVERTQARVAYAKAEGRCTACLLKPRQRDVRR